jgi:hypothetical protein
MAFKMHVNIATNQKQDMYRVPKSAKCNVNNDDDPPDFKLYVWHIGVPLLIVCYVNMSLSMSLYIIQLHQK